MTGLGRKDACRCNACLYAYAERIPACEGFALGGVCGVGVAWVTAVEMCGMCISAGCCRVT